MTRIVITGACGKMGRVINDIVNTRDDCEITAGIDIACLLYTSDAADEL